MEVSFFVASFLFDLSWFELLSVKSTLWKTIIWMVPDSICLVSSSAGVFDQIPIIFDSSYEIRSTNASLELNSTQSFEKKLFSENLRPVAFVLLKACQ